MNRNNDKEMSERVRKVYARTIGNKKGLGTLKRQNEGLPIRKQSLSDISQGLELKIKPIWIIISAIILLGCVFLFLKRPENSKKLLSANMKVTAGAGGALKIKQVHIMPRKPHSNNDLSANVEIKGNNRDKIQFRYQWYKNAHQIEGARGKDLSHAHFDKGDIIKVTVIPVMMEVEGEPVTSTSVKIKNCPPAMKSVVIQPQLVYTNTDLTVEAEAEDLDQESVGFRYQWIKNGSEIIGEESKYLKHSHFVKDDQIQVQVTPFDSYGHGVSMISSIVLVNNSPPKIISHPPSIFDENGTFVYKVLAKDIDNDSLTFSLSSKNPPGITIDPKSGLLLWKIPHDLEPGPNRIEIIVSDQDGSEASQWFTLNIEFVVDHDHG